MSTTLSSPGAAIVSMQYKEPYVSQALNKKLQGIVGTGILRGGKLVTTGSGLNVRIDPDAVHGDSVYSYEDVNALQFTLRQAGSVTLNLTPVASTTVYIALYVEYALGATTVVQWRAYSESELFGGSPVAEAAFVVVVGKVIVPAVGPIAAASVLYTHARFAWQSTSQHASQWLQLVENSGFELARAASLPPGTSTLPNWDHSAFGAGPSGADVVNVAPHAGRAELRVTGFAAPSTDVLKQRKTFAVRSGQRLHASIWLRGSGWGGVGGSGAPLDAQGVRLRFFTSDFASVSDTYIINNALTGTFVYTEVSDTVLVPATAVWMTIEIVVISSAAESGLLFIDDCRVWLEVGTPLTLDEKQNQGPGELRTSDLDLVPPDPSTLSDLVNRSVLFRHNGLVSSVDTLEMLKRNSSSAWDLRLNRGRILFNLASYPAAATDPGKDKAEAKNQVKVWAQLVADGAGNVTINDGYGLATAIISGQDIVVTFHNAFSSANQMTPFVEHIGGTVTKAFIQVMGTGGVTIRLWNISTNTQINLASAANTIVLMVMGRQA